MDKQLTLSDELRKLVEARLEQTLKGTEDTFNRILEKQEITPKELKEELKSLEENCDLLFQKWSLEILYTLSARCQSGCLAEHQEASPNTSRLCKSKTAKYSLGT